MREGHALYDNLYLSRIEVNADSACARILASLQQEAVIRTDVPNLFTGSIEAEATKLFANPTLPCGWLASMN